MITITAKTLNEEFLEAKIKTAMQFVISGVSDTGFAQLHNAHPGRRYKIDFYDEEWCKTSHFTLQYQYQGVKYIIGQRRYYATIEEAVAMAELWWALLRNADDRSGWSHWISRITVTDTEFYNSPTYIIDK